MRRLLGTTIFLNMDIIDFLTCLTKLDKRKLQTSSFSLGSARHHRSSSVLSVILQQLHVIRLDRLFYSLMLTRLELSSILWGRVIML